jgi:hypothetical protein
VPPDTAIVLVHVTVTVTAPQVQPVPVLLARVYPVGRVSTTVTVPDVALVAAAMFVTVISQTAVCPWVKVPEGAFVIDSIGVDTIVTVSVFELTGTVLPLPFTVAVLLTLAAAFEATLTISVSVGKEPPDATTFALVHVIV